MSAAAAAAGEDVTPEDWRLLRTLFWYRLLLLAGLGVVCVKAYAPFLFERIDRAIFLRSTLGYGAAALGLSLAVLYRKPGLVTQSLLHFFVDASGICLLVYHAHGLASGLGV